MFQDIKFVVLVLSCISEQRKFAYFLLIISIWIPFRNICTYIVIFFSKTDLACEYIELFCNLLKDKDICVYYLYYTTMKKMFVLKQDFNKNSEV